MCGRYGLYDVTESTILKENTGYDFKPNYNAAPTQSMPVITLNNNQKAIAVMQWGITRKLGPQVEKNIFNTRSEKALDRFWGKNVKTHRCLVPANGFYEWRKTTDGKIPFWIHSPTSSLIYFAGIFDEDAEGNRHYSIMTTPPNKEMSEIHDRMPVILQKEAQDGWLLAASDESEFLAELMKPLPDNSLEMYEVSKEVNIVKNNNGQLLLPINSK
jgi:putative SOS response-associated peptidase YedK